METHTVFVVFAGRIRNENDISEYLLWGEHLGKKIKTGVVFFANKAHLSH